MNSTIFERSQPPASAISHSLSVTRYAPFWIDDVRAGADGTLSWPAQTGDERCDLAVVGGGYSGLWTALLAKRAEPDKRVILLEGERIGWAASGRNGGFCEASLTHGDDNGMTRFPDEFEQLQALGLNNLNEIEASVRKLGFDCDFERNGSLSLATEEHQIEWMRDEAISAGAQFLDQNAIRAQVNSPTYLAGAWHTRTSALLHPYKLALALARACANAGVEIHENSAVFGLNTRGLSAAEGTELSTANGTVRAKKTALATNAFPSLLKRNMLATVPVYDYVLMTEPLTDAQLASIGWSNRQGLGDSANQFHYYRLSADNRILFGGYDAIYYFGGRVRAGYEDRAATFATLASHFFTTFPQLEGITFTNRWSGAIDTCSRFCAFFGSARNSRIAYATGFTGLGVASTHFGAKVMLDLLAGAPGQPAPLTERTSLAMVRSRPLPFPPEPIAALGINATRWSLDRADHNEGKRNLILKTLDALGLGFDS